MRRERTDAVLPTVQLAAANVGLSEVIEHEALRGKFLHKLNRGRKLTRIDQNIIREAVPLQMRDPAKKIRTEQEAIVGLGLHDVSKSY